MTVAMALLIALAALAACSTTAGRFDTRPDLCRDLGKQQGEC